MNGRFEAYDRGDRGVVAAWPTNDDLTLVIAGWPYAEFDANKHGHRREITWRRSNGRRPSRIAFAPQSVKSVSSAPPCRTSSASRSAQAGRWSATRATTKTSSRHKGSATRSAMPSSAHRAWTNRGQGRVRLMPPWRRINRRRDQHVGPIFEFTCQFAMMAPPPPEMQQLFGAVHGNREAMDGFVKVVAGVLSPAEFFSPDNVGRILAAAASATTR